MKIICPECKGNGYITIYHPEGKPDYKDCKYCNNQGEVKNKEIEKLIKHERILQ